MQSILTPTFSIIIDDIHFLNLFVKNKELNNSRSSAHQATPSLTIIPQPLLYFHTFPIWVTPERNLVPRTYSLLSANLKSSNMKYSLSLTSYLYFFLSLLLKTHFSIYIYLISYMLLLVFFLSYLSHCISLSVSVTIKYIYIYISYCKGKLLLDLSLSFQVR